MPSIEKEFVLTFWLHADDAMSNPKEIVPSWRGRFEEVRILPVHRRF